LLELGLTVFTPRELGLGVDRRRLWDALQRLTARGILQRVSRGVYRVTTDIAKVLSLRVRRLNGHPVKDSPKESDGTRVGFAGRVAGRAGVVGGSVVEGPLFDNVRGVSVSGVYRCGDRGRVLGSAELVFFGRVSYAEVLWRVRGFTVPGLLAVYTNASQDGEALRIEWRPSRGFVRRNGLGSALRMYWEVVLVVARALVELLLREAPTDVLRRFLDWLSGRAGGLVCVSASLTG